MYEELMDEMRRNRADIVTSGYIRDYQTDSIIERERLPQGIYEGEKLRTELQANLFSTEYFWQIMVNGSFCGKIFARELVFPEQLKVDDAIILGEDAVCVYSCVLKAKKIVVSGKEFYHYCMRKGSLSKSEHEWNAIKILLDGMNRVFKDREDMIPNFRAQFVLYKTYAILAQNANRILYYKDSLLFPYGRLEQGERVVIYGAGTFGGQFWKWFQAHVSCELIAWVDAQGEDEGSVLRPNVLMELDFDKVFIAIILYSVALQAKKQLIALGVDESKIYMLDAKLILEQEREGG
jgi:hypothetical protein